MSRRLAALGIRTLLLVTKSVVYLRRLFGSGPGKIAARGITAVAKSTLYLVLLVVSPLYTWYWRFRRGLERVLATSPARWLGPFSHRYLLHALTLLVVAVTVTTNLTSQPAGAEEFGEGRLVLEVVGVDDGLDFVAIPALPESLSLEENIPDDTGSETPPRSYLSYGGEAIFQPYLPTTETSVAPRTRIEEYTVAEGDTPAGIAARFQLRLVTLLESNNLTERSLIRPGQKLTILPTDGLVHTVARGESIGGIAKRYSVTDEAVLSFNNITDPTSVKVGDKLIVPGGKRPAPPPVSRTAQRPANVPASAAVDSGTRLLWPTVDHRINQYYHYRHAGVDIKGRMGVPIYAAESGTVIESRWGGAYGNMIVIRHDNGLVTRYAHNSQNLVRVGESVNRGQTIALMGSTGRSTGPHLHFEVITRGQRVNPLSYTR